MMNPTRTATRTNRDRRGTRPLACQTEIRPPTTLQITRLLALMASKTSYMTDFLMLPSFKIPMRRHWEMWRAAAAMAAIYLMSSAARSLVLMKWALVWVRLITQMQTPCKIRQPRRPRPLHPPPFAPSPPGPTISQTPTNSNGFRLLPPFLYSFTSLRSSAGSLPTPILNPARNPPSLLSSNSFYSRSNLCRLSRTRRSLTMRRISRNS